MVVLNQFMTRALLRALGHSKTPRRITQMSPHKCQRFEKEANWLETLAHEGMWDKLGRGADHFDEILYHSSSPSPHPESGILEWVSH